MQSVVVNLNVFQRFTFAFFTLFFLASCSNPFKETQTRNTLLQGSVYPPVAGALVSVYQYSSDWVLVGQTTTDGAGNFSIVPNSGSSPQKGIRALSGSVGVEPKIYKFVVGDPATSELKFISTEREKPIKINFPNSLLANRIENLQKKEPSKPLLEHIYAAKSEVPLLLGLSSDDLEEEEVANNISKKISR